MKKIEAIVQPFKMEEVKEALKNIKEAVELVLEENEIEARKEGGRLTEIRI